MLLSSFSAFGERIGKEKRSATSKEKVFAQWTYRLYAGNPSAGRTLSRLFGDSGHISPGLTSARSQEDNLEDRRLQRRVCGPSEDTDQQLATPVSACVQLWERSWLLMEKMKLKVFTALQETADSIIVTVSQNPNTLS